jgi:Mg-chelatase subunit ChlD
MCACGNCPSCLGTQRSTLIDLTDIEKANLVNQITEFNNEAREAELKRQRLERFSQFFGRVNSAFTLRKIQVKVEHSQINSPAWSGATQVVFNSRLIGDLKTPREIAGLRGLDLHEVSHILYTSREGSEIFEWCREKEYLFAYNALEDQRIETLFTTRYPSTIAWFTSTILIHFVDDPKAFESSYALLRGRKYLPTELLARSRNAFPKQDQLDEICDIVDQYRLLIFPTDTEKAKELIERFDKLLPRQEVPNDKEAEWERDLTGNHTKVVINMKSPFGHGERPHEGIESNVNSRPVSPIKQKGDRDRASKANHIDEKELADQLKEIEIDLTDDTSLDQNGSGDQDGELSNALNELLDNILSDNEIANDLNNIIRQIGGLPSLATNNSKEPNKAKYKTANPDPNTFQASLAFSRELERLQATFDPAWDRYQSQGRLQAHRYLRGDDLDTIFDQWNEGRESATEIECVILLDNSGSMSGRKADRAYRAMYAVKRALDRINANTSVITFNNETQTLYRANEKATNVIRDNGAGGGTEPNQAIKYATKLLAETEKPVRIFFVITDGDWYSDQEQNHDLIKQMSNAGVVTAFAYITEQGERLPNLTLETKHYCEIGAVINNPLDLIGMSKSIVKYAISRRLVNA